MNIRLDILDQINYRYSMVLKYLNANKAKIIEKKSDPIKKELQEQLTKFNDPIFTPTVNLFIESMTDIAAVDLALVGYYVEYVAELNVEVKRLYKILRDFSQRKRLGKILMQSGTYQDESESTQVEIDDNYDQQITQPSFTVPTFPTPAPPTPTELKTVIPEPISNQLPQTLTEEQKQMMPPKIEIPEGYQLVKKGQRPKADIQKYNESERYEIVKKAYYGVKQGKRTIGHISKFLKLEMGITMSKTTIFIYLKKLGLLLEGDTGRITKLKMFNQWMKNPQNQQRTVINTPKDDTFIDNNLKNQENVTEDKDKL